LGGGEIVSGDLLEARDRVAERTDIVFGQRRQRFDENKSADFRGQGGFEIGEAREGGLFVAAVHAFGSRVEDDNHPPLWWEIHAGDDRRRRGSSAAPAIDNESAVLEKAQANPGTRASPQQKRIV
jgi:hypothetical protein